MFFIDLNRNRKIPPFFLMKIVKLVNLLSLVPGMYGNVFCKIRKTKDFNVLTFLKINVPSAIDLEVSININQTRNT